MPRRIPRPVNDLPPGYLIITIPTPTGQRDKAAIRIRHDEAGRLTHMGYVPLGFTPGNAPLTRRKRSEIVRDLWALVAMEEADALRAENEMLKAELVRLTQEGAQAVAS